MKCPVCKDVDLIVTELWGAEIERCPMCCGVWFDRSLPWTDSSQDLRRPRRTSAPISREDAICTIASARKRTTCHEFRKELPSELGPPKGP
jgi:Zn-finger nucleic acid-binding protein